MIPWEKLDTAAIPGTDDELRLMRRGKEFSIMLGTNELMNSVLSGSEAALATLAAKKIEKVAKPHCSSAASAWALRCVRRWAYSATRRKSWWSNSFRPSSPGPRPDGGNFWRQPQ
jgi:hypothetical protein